MRARARACVRSFRGAPTRRVPGREGEAEGGAEGYCPGQSRPPRAGSEVQVRHGRWGRLSLGPGACGEGVSPVATSTPGTAASHTPRSPRVPAIKRFCSASGDSGCGFLRLGVGLQSCPGDGMRRIYSSLWWGQLLAGSPTLILGVASGALFLGPLCLSTAKAAERALSGNLKSKQALVAFRQVSELCRAFIVASFGYRRPLILWIL